MSSIITDTISALATPAGGAIAVIRLSGDKAIDITDSIFSRDLKSAKGNTLHYGEITDGGDVVDDVVVAVYRAPHSYTGEDCVEISCHGSRYVIQQILMLLQAHGARQAEPGEYTKRAYLNGKMDLSQAEAVADLIASTNRVQHQMAMSQLKGHFSDQLALLRERLLKLTSLLELELDFSDHENLEFADRSELAGLVWDIDARIMRLADSFSTGNALKEGIPVAIVGKTNVGKSTLLNALLHEERAIVSDVHGTTRDTIEDTMTINGVLFRFIDTAGLRQTTDRVEQIGIDRTMSAISRATVVLWLVDQPVTPAASPSPLTASPSVPVNASPSVNDEFGAMPSCGIEKALVGKRVIIVHTKADLHPVPSATCSVPHSTNEALSSPAKPAYAEISISAKTGSGIDALERMIYDSLDLPELSSSDVVVTNARHHAALIKAHDDLARVSDGLAVGLSADLLAEDLRLVIDDLATITGQQRITPQETLNNIFSHFCVGK